MDAVGWVGISVLMLGGAALVWGLARRVLRTVRTDESRKAAWEGFARRNGFEIGTAPGPAPVREIGREWLRRSASRCFTREEPVAGEMVLRGTREGLAVRLDVVGRGKWWIDLHDDFTRCTVEVPGLPPEVEAFSPRRHGHGAAGQASVRLARGRLDAWRLAALGQTGSRFHAAELAEGRLVVVVRGAVTDPAVLETLVAAAVALGHSLSGVGSAPSWEGPVASGDGG